MKKDPDQIVERIISLLSELAALAGGQTDSSTTRTPAPVFRKKLKAGPVGGIRLSKRYRIGATVKAGARAHFNSSQGKGRQELEICNPPLAFFT